MYLLLTRFLLVLVGQPTPDSTPAANAVPCIACRADLDAMRQGYSAGDWQALTRGEIVTSQTEEPKADGSVQSDIASSAIISAPPELVWSVLLEPEARSKLTPGVRSVRIVRADGNRMWVALHLRFFVFVNIRYQIVDTLDPEHGLLTWALDRSADHDIADTTGSWQIAALPTGTLARYRAWIDTGKPVPRFVADFFIKQSLPKVIGGLRSEVQRRLQQVTGLHDRE